MFNLRDTFLRTPAIVAEGRFLVREVIDMKHIMITVVIT